MAREVAPRHWKIPRSEKISYLDDGGRLNRDVRLQPVSGAEPGTLSGVTIAHLSPESPLAAAGFRQGDRILAVNGAPVATLQRAANLVHEIRAAAVITVEAERDGGRTAYRFEFE